MKLLKAIIRPDKIDAVKEALRHEGVSGMTISEVRGHGSQKGHVAIYRGQEYRLSLLPKVEIEVAVPDHWAAVVCDAIADASRTGEIGDGRIFVISFDEAYRIRTRELEE
jgi:nitrogen regulatory protein PII